MNIKTMTNDQLETALNQIYDDVVIMRAVRQSRGYLTDYEERLFEVWRRGIDEIEAELKARGER